MGVKQMGEPETSGNTTSKRQEKTRRTSGDSNTAPKADQSSCLREAFICLFLKRTEHNDRGEDPPTKNQSTEDKESFRVKKQRVMGGSIFRLPCLRPADSTDSCEHSNNPQDKIEEHGNQVMAEEELKPYSKASFLRKIRGYRLMRERDTTEKEKVIEIAQCTHSMESVVKEHREQKSENVLEPNNHEDMVEEKGKVMSEQESWTIVLGGKVHNLLEQDGHAECTGKMDFSLREKESPAVIRDQGKDLPQQKGHGERAVNIGKDPVKLESQVEIVGNMSQKQESHTKGAGGMKDFLEEASCTEKLEDLGSELVEKLKDLGSELVEKLEDLGSELEEKVEDLSSESTEKVEDLASDMEEKMEDLGSELKEKVEDKGTEFVEKEEDLKSELEEKVEDLGSELLEHGSKTERVWKQEKDSPNQKNKAKKLGHQAKDLIENKSQPEVLGKVGNYILEQDSHAQEVREKGTDLLEQDSHAHEVSKLGNSLPEQERQAVEVVKVFIGQDSHAGEVGKIRYENNLPEQDIQVKMLGEVGKDLSEFESCGGIAQELENDLFEMGSHTENAGKCGIICLQTESCAKNVGEQGKNSLEQDTFYLEKVEEPGKELPEQSHKEIVKVQKKVIVAKGSQAHKVGESGQNTKEFPQASSSAEDGFRGIQEGAHLFQGFVPSDACPQDSFTLRASGENGELDTSVRKKSLATNTTSITILEEPQTQQESSQKSEDKDDMIGCEATDWGSLKVEVTDMVQWLVEEASDRLTYYTQESDGTG
ncbi:uncharacterized protein LOC134947880 [Pseudophryne corroboree]|uniref:uncharacterized protein LOC134947880 n=1 Tax=Pseudophryne corroboree TaxID=495146 RepID=UPI003081EC80